MSSTSVSGSGAITVTLDEKIYVGPVSVDTHGATLTVDVPSFLAGNPPPSTPTPPKVPTTGELTGKVTTAVGNIQHNVGTALNNAQNNVNGVKATALGTVNSVVGGASMGLQGVLQSVTGGAADALAAIKGALPSVPGAGGLPLPTQASSIGAVSLVEDASKTLLVSFKDGPMH